MHFDQGVLQRANVTQTEIDGVPTFYGDSAGVFTAGIGFRCGYVDESLPSRGITHLLEHLSLHGLQSPTLSINGHVDTTTTWFYAQGAVTEVVDFMATLTARLSDLPHSRAARERAVLDIESDRAGAWDHILRTRYGPSGYGLTGYSQLGLPLITEETLEAHAARYFTRQNCAVFLTSPPPANLKLNLRDGGRTYAPDPRLDRLEEGRSYLVDFDDAVVFHSPVERCTAQSVMAFVLDNRLKDHLRFNLGLSYSPMAGYRPWSPHGATVFGTIDSDAARIDSATQQAIEIMLDLTSGTLPITDQELSAYQANVALSETASAGSRDTASFFVDRHINGLDVPADLVSEVDALTPEDLATAGLLLANKLVVGVPEGSVKHLSNWTRVNPGVSGGLSGTFFAARDARNHESLVIGADGVGIHEDCAPFVSARDVAGVLTYSNGARVVLGNDSAALTIVPNQWHKGPDAIKLIDQTFAPLLIPTDLDGPEYTPAKQLNWLDSFFLGLSVVVAIAAAIIAPLLMILPSCISAASYWVEHSTSSRTAINRGVTQTVLRGWVPGHFTGDLGRSGAIANS